MKFTSMRFASRRLPARARARHRPTTPRSLASADLLMAFANTSAALPDLPSSKRLSPSATSAIERCSGVKSPDSIAAGNCSDASSCLPDRDDARPSMNIRFPSVLTRERCVETTRRDRVACRRSAPARRRFASTLRPAPRGAPTASTRLERVARSGERGDVAVLAAGSTLAVAVGR